MRGGREKSVVGQSLCRAGRPVVPPPGVSQTESRSCQALRRVKRGRTDCAILEPG